MGGGRFAGVIAGASLSFVSLTGAGAPSEIKVFTDELANYGEHTLETHVNKASRAGRLAEHRATPFQVMPEYSYGIWHNWEFSLQLPVAEGGGHWRSNGYRAELQYVAPHDEDAGYYWGLNAELARVTLSGEPQLWDLELIPILGYRLERWHLAANPGLSIGISGPDRKVNFSPAAKVAYKAFGKNYYGIEYYLDAGPARHWLPGNQRSSVVYLVWDGKIAKSDINLGIGRGFTDASDLWVLKMIYEIAF